MWVQYNSIELNITKKVAQQCAHSGDNSEEVNRCMQLPKYKKQLDSIDSEQLKEFGAWTDKELSNHFENLERIF